MELEPFDKIEKNLKDMKDKSFISEFITEITNYLNNFKDKKVKSKEKEEKTNNLKEEDCLYQVVDFSLNGVYLQNTNNNVIFEEKNLSAELKNIISNDYILRYKNGAYKLEEKITEQFFESMVDINKYKEIQKKFEKRSGILRNGLETRYGVLSRDKEFTTLKYKYGQIEVPNVLLPFFINNKSILYYKNGKFHKDMTK